MTSILLIFLGNPQLGGAAPDVPQAVVIVPHCLSQIFWKAEAVLPEGVLRHGFGRHYLTK